MRFSKKRFFKIQFLINSFGSGGAERVASNLIMELSNLGYKVKVYSIFSDNFYKSVNFLPLIKSKFSKGVVSLIKVFISVPKYIYETYKGNCDVLLSFLELSNFISVIAAKICRKKVIISVRNSLSLYESNSIYSKFNSFLIKVLYSKADRIIVISKKVKEMLIERFNFERNRISVIYNLHDISKYEEFSKEELSVKDEFFFKNVKDSKSFVFVNVASLTEQKGHWFLIRAFKKVVEVHPNSKLIIIGDGELRVHLQELIEKLGLECNVFLLGKRSNPFSLIKRSDCFVLSSIREGLPNVLIEALSLNIPIISTDCVSGPREILDPKLDINKKVVYPHFGEFGVLSSVFPRKYIFKDLSEVPFLIEESLFANLMIKMIEDDVFRGRYENGLKRAKDFDKKKIMSEWVKVIKEIS